MSKKKPDTSNVIAANRRARHDYFIEDRVEAGLSLQGWEVKSLREGRAQLTESYVTIRNGEAFLVDAFAPLLDFKEGEQPEATFDLSTVYGKNLKSARRRFCREGPGSLLIQDEIEISENTELITWQLMTTASVVITEEGAVLAQDGKKLNVENLSHPGIAMSVVSLYPAPLKLDRQIEGLKRLELRIPAWVIENGRTEIKIRLSAEE